MSTYPHCSGGGPTAITIKFLYVIALVRQTIFFQSYPNTRMTRRNALSAASPPMMPSYKTYVFTFPLGNSQTKVTPFSQISALVEVRSITQTALLTFAKISVDQSKIFVGQCTVCIPIYNCVCISCFPLDIGAIDKEG